jgi:hypothetical protein
MATPSPVRLLIADQSENRAHEIESVLRNAGIATRAEFCKDLSEDSVTDQAVDLILCHVAFDHLERVLPALRSRGPVPIIVMDVSKNGEPDARPCDRRNRRRVRHDNERLFLYVVKRE